MISEEKQEVICKMVQEYVSSENLIPAGHKLILTLSLVSDSSVKVVDKTDEYDPKILDTDAIDSFDAYYYGFKSGGARTRTAIIRLSDPNNDNYPSDKTRRSHRTTVREIVTYGTDQTEDFDPWLFMQHVGPETIKLIDKWLKSLNLRRGMNF